MRSINGPVKTNQISTMTGRAFCYLAFLAAPVAAQTAVPAQTAALSILDKNCSSCHGAAQMSGLDLRQRETTLKGGKRGAAVVPGNAEASILYQAVAGQSRLKKSPGTTKLFAPG